MEPALKRDLRNYPLYFLIWTIIGVFFFSQGIVQKFFSHDPTPWWHHLLSWLVGVYLWALLTPGVLWLGRRFPIERRDWVRRGALHLLLGVVVTLVQLAVESAILPRLGVFPTLMTKFTSTLAFLLVIGFHNGIMTYWTVLGVQYGVRYYQDYQERKQEALRLELHASELQSQLVQAQLGVLKMQLQPHFLFNTLGAIMVLIQQQKTSQAEAMVARLGDLLRLTLDDVKAQEVPLWRELDFLRLYLSIEQVRFEDRLRVRVAADPGVSDAFVPHMVLQPIVENAVRHGLGQSEEAMTIDVRATAVHPSLMLVVSDDGPGLPAPGSDQVGIGLTNTRNRLARLYGSDASLVVENAMPRGVRVTITLPLRMGLSEEGACV